MHFTTLVSLIAVGAVAAPAGLSSKSLGFATSVPYPTLPSRSTDAEATPSPASDIMGGVAKLKEVDLSRRQEEAAPATSSGEPSFRSVTAKQDAADAKEAEAAEAEKDPLDDYLETFEDDGGKFNETKQEDALNTFNSDFEKRQADSELDAYLATLDGDGEYDSATADKALGDYHTALDGGETEAKTEEPAAPKNETSTELPAAKNETSAAAPSKEGQFDVEALMEKAKAGGQAPESETSAEPAAAKEEDAEPTAEKEESSSTEPAAANEEDAEPTAEKDETSSAAPEPTAAPESSSGPLDDVTGGLPVKRQDLPDLPEVPDLDKVTSEVIKRQAEDVEDAEVATPAVEEKNVTAPAVDEKNATAASNETASAGFHGINEKLAKLNKLPIGGLPIKRQEGPPSDTASAQPTGGKPAAPESEKPSSSLLDKYLVALGQPAGAGAGAAPSKPAEKSNATAPNSSEKKPESEESDPLASILGEESEAPSAGGPPASESAPAESESEESSPLAGLMGESSGAPSAPAESKESNATAKAAPVQQKPESEESDPLADILGEESKESAAPSTTGPPASEGAPAAESSEAAGGPLDSLMGKRQEVTEKHQSFVANTDEPAPAPAPAAKSPAPKAEDTGLDSILDDLALV